MKVNIKYKSSVFFLILILVLTCYNSCKENTVAVTPTELEPIEEDIVFGLNAYSFADLMQAKDFRDNEQVYTLFNLLDWCDYKGIKAIDPTGYFFPSYPEAPSDAFLAKFKAKASEYGITISGTGIRNDFANPDPKIRQEGVERAIEWIVVASKLGAPVLRCFAGEIPKGYEDNWEEPASWMIDSYKQLLPYAEQYGVKIGIQNHGDMLQTAEQCSYILKGVDSDWAGIIIDTGNFFTDDPYKDIAEMVPYAVNWQVKEFIDGYGGSVPTDYLKLVKIIKDSGFKGIVPVETLKVKDDPYDPFARVENMIKQLNQALDSVNQTVK